MDKGDYALRATLLWIGPEVQSWEEKGVGLWISSALVTQRWPTDIEMFHGLIKNSFSFFDVWAQAMGDGPSRARYLFGQMKRRLLSISLSVPVSWHIYSRSIGETYETEWGHPPGHLLVAFCGSRFIRVPTMVRNNTIKLQAVSCESSLSISTLSWMKRRYSSWFW